MSICATKLSMQKYGSTAGLVEITSKSMASTFPRACKSKGVHLETIESFSDVNFASLIEDHFGTSQPYTDIILRLLKQDIGYTISESKKKYSMVFPAHIEMKAIEIRKYDPTYSAPVQQSSGTQSSGGCYVATAVYGSYDCPQVWTLRRFRDNSLAETWYGRAFIHTYYAISPTIVKWFGNTTWFKKMWKGTLDRMVSYLNKKGVANTPYKDRKW